MALFQATVPAPAVVLRLGSLEMLARTAGGTSVFGFMPVVPIVLVSGLLMVVVSWLTPKPAFTTLARYFAASAGSR